ncbi:very short patch repair endonuclease [Antricoccus suffuscus]|uniref:very short patch repair endonuclease n=1 Tax=Antricoccus suffuscus TaxID=1629062 RepID=UPI000D04B4CE
MADHLTPDGRSRVMAAIRSKDTKPELALRSALRAAGATGYRLHLRSLPGRPDIAFTRWRVAVFVDGVFWHGHPDHFHPDRSTEYWRVKIDKTRRRDRAANIALAAEGWVVVRVWDQEVKASVGACAQKVIQALARAGWGRQG